MFVRVSVATTVAPGTAAPDESVTLPSSVPVTACACAAAGTMRAAPSTSARAAQTRENTLPDAFKLRRILLPPCGCGLLSLYAGRPTAGRRLLGGLYYQCWGQRNIPRAAPGSRVQGSAAGFQLPASSLLPAPASGFRLPARARPRGPAGDEV